MVVNESAATLAIVDETRGLQRDRRDDLAGTRVVVLCSLLHFEAVNGLCVRCAMMVVMCEWQSVTEKGAAKSASEQGSTYIMA